MKNLLLVLLITGTTFSFAQKSNEFHLDQSYKVNKSGTIELLSDDADVSIIGQSRSDVAVVINRVVNQGGLRFGDAEFYVEVKEINGNLHIIEHSESNGVMVGYISEDYEIKILAPKGINLDLRGDDDEYKINNIDGSIKIDADDAEITIGSCNSTYFDFDIDDGEIHIDKASGTLKARLDDGELKILNAAFTNIDFVGDDSYVYIATSLSASGDYNLRGDDAEFEIDVLGGGGTFTISHDDGHIRAGSAFDLTYESDNKSTFKLPGGTSQVNFRGDDLSVRLSAQLAN